MGQIAIYSSIVDAMQAAADAAHPHEACGILLGEGTRITALTETSNVHPTPRTHFEIDPQALIDAHRAERAGGRVIIGYFHSHPLGPSAPSDTDRRNSARDGKVWAIIGYDGLRLWEDALDGFHPLSYDAVGRSGITPHVG